MVADARPWQDELVKSADRLEAKTKQKRWADRTGFLIERDFVLAAYAMRKVLESDEVSAELRQRQIPVRRFELSGRRPQSVDDIADCYDFDNGRRRTLSVTEMCHEILHSVVFTFCCGETEDLFDGIYLSSDRDQNEYIYLLLASDFIALCCDIGMGDAQPR